MRTKNIIKSTFLAFIVITMGACEKQRDTEGLSTITYYPEFTVYGDATTYLNVGDSYTDPGVLAESDGVELDVTTETVGDFYLGSVAAVNTASPDKYITTYTAFNKDGYPGTASRVVYVVSTGDLTTNIEGLYTSTIIRVKAADGTTLTGAQYTNMKYVMIKNTGGNNYEITDAIGGWYEFGRALGSGYRAPGLIITANNIATNDYSFSGPVAVGGFGGMATMTTFSVDAAAKTIYFESIWDSGYTFKVTMKQVQI